MKRLSPFAFVLIVVLLFSALAQIPVQAQTTPLAPSNNLPVSTATYVGAGGADETRAVDVAPDGSVVLTGVMPGYSPAGVTPVALLGGGDGIVLRYNRSGTTLQSLTQLPSTVRDMEIDAAGRILVCGNFGLAVLQPDASAVIWSVGQGEVARCAIGQAGEVAALTGKTVATYSADGQPLGTWEIDRSSVQNIALDSTTGYVFTSGFDQKARNLQVAFLFGWTLTGERVWGVYDFAASALSGLGADTRGEVVAMGRDGKLYFAGSINGGTGASIFSRDPSDVRERLGGDRKIETDNFNRPTNVGSVKMTWYARFDPATGTLELGQSLLTRLSSGRGNSISVNAMMADAEGRLFLAGNSSCCMRNRDNRQVGGLTVGNYEGGEAFFLVVSADFRQRLIWTPFTSPEVGVSAGGSPATGVGVRNGVAAVGITFNQREGRNRGMLTFNAAQTQPSGPSEGYLAAWEYAAPAVAVDAGPDQTAFAGATVTLGGNSDADTLSWEQTGGPPTTLNGADTLTPSFAAPAVSEPTVLAFTLTATAPGGAEVSDVVQVTVQPISADAGSDQTVLEGETVTLTGSATGAATLAWEQVSGAPIEFTVVNSATITFAAPADADTLRFQLTASNGDVEASDDVQVTVQPISVDAGPDQAVYFGEESITLAGTGAGIASYAWAQTSGPTVTLTNEDSATAQFSAPVLTDTAALGFVLTGTGQAGNTVTDTVQVTVQPVVADAGDDRSARPGDVIELTSRSRAPADDPIVGYAWEVLDDGGLALDISDMMQPTLVVTLPATITPTLSLAQDTPLVQFQLTVTNTLGLDQDTVTVRVQAREQVYLPIIRKGSS